MKTIHKIKCLAAASSFALLASASPAFSQESVNTPPSQPTDPQMRESSPSDGAIMNEPSGADSSSRNWSWIGLLGLAGLFGLKRHHDVRDENYRQART